MFWRRSVEVALPEPLRLPSNTDGADFDARFSAQYLSGRTFHGDRASLVRHHLLREARLIARDWRADEAHAAQDAINACFGKPRDCPDDFYRKLTAHVELRASADARQAAAQARDDEARIERLRYLRTALYTDPTLLVIEHLDRHPETEIDHGRIEHLRRLADELRHGERWWAPLMTAWNELAQHTSDTPGAAREAMTVLHNAIQRLDATLALRHNLPKTTGDEALDEDV